MSVITPRATEDRLYRIVRANKARSKKPFTPSEKDIERTCTDLMTWWGWRCLKTDPIRDQRRGKGFGEFGMADCLYIRYNAGSTPRAKPQDVQLIWIEWKRLGGKAAPHQRAWHDTERARGALTWIAGIDFPASIEGFKAHYASSGLKIKGF